MFAIPSLWYHTDPYHARSPTIIVVLVPALQCIFISVETSPMFVGIDLFLNTLIVDWLSRRGQLSGIFLSSPSLRYMSSNCNHRIQNLDYIHLHPLYSYVLLRTYFQHLCCLMFLTFFQLIGIMSCLKTWWHVTWVFSLFFFSVVAVVNVMPSLNLPTIFMRFLGSCLKLSNKLCPLQIVLGYLFASWMKLFSVLSMNLPYQSLSAPRNKHVARYSSVRICCTFSKEDQPIFD